MQAISLVIVLLFFVGALSIVYFTLINGISPMISSRQSRCIVADEIRKISGIHTVIDAGSGWGTLAIHLAKCFPNTRIIGLENSLIPLWISQWLSVILSYSKLRFYRKNLYTYDYKITDMVVCYLYPGAMKRLNEIFRHQLKEDTVIISIFFALPGWEPIKTIQCNDMYHTKIYLYQYRKF